jgi:hypothetical protein
MSDRDGGRRGAATRRIACLAGLSGALLLTAASVGQTAEWERRPAHARAIFGNDDRTELHAVADPGVRAAADAVVALVDNNQLDCDASRTTCNLTTAPLSAVFEGPDGQLCADEPFAEQPTAALCTGFLIAPDLVATAGHCIDEPRCPFTGLVFGFAIGTPGGEASTSGLETYRCSEVVESVVHYGFESDGAFQDAADYAVVRLDRPVPNRAPLVLRREPRVAVGDGLVVMGHPFGLPLKVADGGEVRSIAGTFFQTNLDISEGNSGSPVLDLDSLEVVGILVRGAQDLAFDEEQQCFHSARYTDADGELQRFAQATHAGTLPLVDSCIETMSCPETTAVATCAFSERVFGHSSRCQECSSEPRPVRAVRRRIDRSQRLLARGLSFGRLRTVRKATKQLQRGASELDRLSNDGRVSDQCVGALRSVIDESLGIAQYGLDMFER